MYCRRMLIMLLVPMLLAGRFTPTARAQGATYTDPFAYCAAVGTIDAPDARYIGPNVPEAIARALQAATGTAPDAPLDQFVTVSSWRCMDGKVYACAIGANLPCQEQADTSQTPTTAMTKFCQANPSGAIPAFVTGRATVYVWECRNRVAAPGRQVMEVDTRGFLATIWYVINPEGAAGAQTMPRTGGASSFSGGTMVLMVLLGAMAMLLGLLIRRYVQGNAVDA